MIRFLVVLALAFTCIGVPAQSTDDQYLSIYTLIQQGDALGNAGRSAEARAKYVEAQTVLQKFKQRNPQWNPVVVDFRLSYLAEKIGPAAAPQNPPVTETPAAAPVKPKTTLPVPIRPAEPTPVEPESETSRLQGTIQGLQAEKASLEARLKEALAAQPAVSDPRELARAEEKIRSLQKENETLKMSLSQEKSKSPAAVSANTLEQAQRALADANTKLAEQSRRAETLALEKQVLQQRLDSVNPSAWNTNSFEKTRKALEEANRQLAEQNDSASKLKSEKDALAAKVKAMEGDAAMAASLRAENQSLRKQLTDLAALRPGGATNAFVAQAAPVPPIAAGLAAQSQDVRLEQALQEAAVSQTALSASSSRALTVPAAKPSSQTLSAPASSVQTSDAARIKQLEKERDEYQKKLDAAIKELYGKKGKAANARIEAAENQVAILRARLEIYEARQVPYSEEELALFRKPEPKLAEADAKVARKSVSELPPGAVKLAVEAQRYYAARQLDKAEETYQEVVKQDSKNPTSLANLAAIQMENNHLDEADKHISAAVAAAPENPYALAILGQVCFRQGRYDDALDALSHAAKLDPRSAQIQNFLGITLGQKGLRGPAETALRKAIQLDPNYGEAHHNLAVSYLTQSPPLVELARWHYQKALAAGTPRNKELENLFAAKRPGESTP